MNRIDSIKVDQKKSEEFKSPDVSGLRRFIMSPFMKLAAAAVIIAGILAGVNYFGAQVKFASPVFADVIQEIKKAHSVIYTRTITADGRDEDTTKHFLNEYGNERCEHGNLWWMVYDHGNGKLLTVTPDNKMAIMHQMVGRDKRVGLLNHLDWMAQAHEKFGQFKGREKLDGRIADVFVIEGEYHKTTIWVDPQTNLPVRIEKINEPALDKDIVVPRMVLSDRDFGGKGERNAETSVTGDGVQNRFEVVDSNFIWNPQLDESLFSIEPPDGYKVEETRDDQSPAGEKHLMEALAFWTEVSEGSFPTKIEDFGDANQVKPLLVRKFRHNGDPKEEFEMAQRQMNLILKALWFTQRKKIEGSWRYLGEGVTLGEGNKPVCWWRSVDSEKYRLIYGDLSIGDANANELPEPP
jgi:hypothetical protein